MAEDDPPLLDTYRLILSLDSLSEQCRGHLAARGVPVDFSLASPELHLCRGAQEAVEQVQKAMKADRRFTLCILDVSMAPGLDGIWAAQQIHMIDPNLDLILVSGFAEGEEAIAKDRIPSPEKLFFIRIPFHQLEIRQLAIALCLKRVAENQLRRLAFNDPLTGLPNRRAFLSLMDRVVALAERRNQRFAVLSIDLNDFKSVNDDLGHAVGDLVLAEIASRLQRETRCGDAIGRMIDAVPHNHLARMGGDEYAVLLCDVVSRKEAVRVAQRLCRNLSLPMVVGSHELSIKPSVGIALYPDDGCLAENLLHKAGLPMYSHKRSATRLVEPIADEPSTRQLAPQKLADRG